MERIQRSNEWSHSLVTKQDDCYEVYIPPQEDCYEVYVPPQEGSQQGRCSPLFVTDNGYVETPLTFLPVQQSNEDYCHEVYRSPKKNSPLNCKDCSRRDSRKRKLTQPTMLTPTVCNKEISVVERDPHIFPFFELPVELRVAILREIWPRQLKTFRLVSRAMGSLIDNIAPRTWKNVLIDYTSGPRFFFRQINCRGWVLLRHCTACVEMFGLARGASIPRLFFHKAKITDFFMRRLSTAAKKSKVAVQHCEFSMCNFTCGAEQLVEFLEICKTEKLAIVECVVATEFTQFLVKNSFIMKINIIISHFSLCSKNFPPADSFSYGSICQLLRLWMKNRTSLTSTTYINAKLPVDRKRNFFEFISKDHCLRDYCVLRNIGRDELYISYKNGLIVINCEYE